MFPDIYHSVNRMIKKELVIWNMKYWRYHDPPIQLDYILIHGFTSNLDMGYYYSALHATVLRSVTPHRDPSDLF